MAAPSEDQVREATRLADQYWQAARARLLPSSALEVEIDRPVRRSYLIDREGRVVAERKSRRWRRPSAAGTFATIGAFLFVGAVASCSSADNFVEGETKERLFWISAGVAAIGFLILKLTDALDHVAKRRREGRGGRDVDFDWFDIPPTRRSPEPVPAGEAAERVVHPLDVIEDVASSVDEDSDDPGDDGDSD